MSARGDGGVARVAVACGLLVVGGVIGLVSVAYSSGRRRGFDGGFKGGWAMAHFYSDMKTKFEAMQAEGNDG